MKISCPHCGQHYDVEETDLGKEAECINCGQRFTIPNQAGSAQQNRWTLIGVWAIFSLLAIFGVIWGIWQINAANAEKERIAEEKRIQFEIIQEENIDKCVTYLRKLAWDCVSDPQIKKYPTFPALQKKARDDVRYLEAFSEDFEKYLKERNESNRLAWYKEKIFGDEK